MISAPSALGRATAMLAVLVAFLTAPALAGASPSIVGSVSDPVSLSGIRSVAVSGHYAYTPSYYNGELTAIDISNPAAPSVAGESASNNAVYNADYVTISNGYAYVTSKAANASTTNVDDGYGNALSIFDIHTNPAHPAFVGSVSDPTGHTLFGAYGVAVSGNYAYVAAQGCTVPGPPCPSSAWGNDVDVIDISQPASPTIAATITSPGNNVLDHADGIAVSGNHAYVSSAYGHALAVISLDTTTPTNDTIVGSLVDATNMSFPNDVAVAGNYAYVADGGTQALDVVDVSNPAAPRLAEHFADPRLHGAYRVVVNGHIAYVAADQANAISAVDITNPLAPSIVASMTDGAHLNHTSGLDFALAGRYVIASSPYLSSETQSDYPPYPTPYPAPYGSGPTNTGTISVIDMDAKPVTVTITSPANGATYKAGQRVVAAYTCAPGAYAPVTSCSGPVASGTRLNTTAPGQHTFTVNAQDALGQTGTATVTYTVLPGPRFTFVRQLSRRWTEPHTPTVKKLPIGTVFWFTLNTKAKLTFTFTLLKSGRKSGHRCVAPTSKNKHHASCTRKIKAGTLRLTAVKGGNAVRFRGKIGHRHLAPGTYVLVITASANGLTSHTTLKFTIVR